MSRSILSRAAVAFVNAFESAERSYVKTASVVLNSIYQEVEDTEGLSVAKLWREENVESYGAAKLVRGMTKYGQLTKLNSYLLAISERNPELFRLYARGEYPCSSQLAYAKLPARKGSKKAATKKLTVAQKLAQNYTVKQLQAALKIALKK